MYLRSKEYESTLFITTLDAQKAFDVVDYKMLQRKLYLDGIRGNDAKVFVIRQGVRQGGVLSSSHYKIYNNPLLLQLEDKYTGTLIGSIRIPHVTVADDLLLISKAELEMQDMLYDIDDCTDQDRYLIQPGKSTSLIYPDKKENPQNRETFKMNGKDIKVEQNTVHLGIERDI